MATTIIRLLLVALTTCALQACGGGDAPEEETRSSCIGGILYGPSGVPVADTESGVPGKVKSC